MPRLQSLYARPILNSRGAWTIEVYLAFDGGLIGSASVPEGKSKGEFEAHAVSPEEAVANIHEKVLPALGGKEFSSQAGVDNALRELDSSPQKSSIGANVTLGVSLAAARALAQVVRKPLWRFLREEGGFEAPARGLAPRLFANVINGGLHAGGALRVQEYLVIAKEREAHKAVSTIHFYYEALKHELRARFGPASVNVGDEGGFAPPFRDDVAPLIFMRDLREKMKLTERLDFGIDAAAGSMEEGAGGLEELYERMQNEVGLVYIEDPFSESEEGKFKALTEKLGAQTIIAGDDLTATNPERIKRFAGGGAINGVIIKPNQIGTLSEAFRAVREARRANAAVIVSHRSGETNDDIIADVAYGVGADGFKLGAPARGERVEKYNRLLAIQIEDR